MNIVDAACSKCGKATKYDGRLPILCRACWEASNREQETVSLARILKDAGFEEITVSGEEIYVHEVAEYAKARGCNVKKYPETN